MLNKLNHIINVSWPFVGGTELVYYFHSDHLGSASWITSGAGAAVQHLLYLPFGEHFVNERNTAYDERFTFTGKERDAETGYYYHGARFNSSDLGWLSVDPMADKYPSLTPYNYCAWNPVKLVDPDGRVIKGVSMDSQGNIVLSKGVSKHTRRVYEAMSKTKLGTSQFKKMVESATVITFEIVKKKLDGGKAHGMTQPGEVSNGIYETATIIISTAKNGDRFDNATEEEMINAIGVHESVHAISKEQIIKDLAMPDSWETERDPIEMEYTSRTEYNKGNNDSFKHYYEDENSELLDIYGNTKPSYHLKTNIEE